MVRWLTHLLVPGALLLVSGVSAAQDTALSSLAPLVTHASGLDQSNGALRPTYEFAQQPGKPLCFEAEQASILQFTAGKGVMGRDPDASAGLYVAFVDRMEFRFDLREAGPYTAWYRASFPLTGNWNHTENMDGGPTRTQTDSRGEVLDRWLWVKGPGYDLTAGKHSWNFTPFAWCGGAKLDRVVLSNDPAFTPEGAGPSATPPAGTPAGEALTEQLMPRDLMRWQALSFQNLTGQGTVRVLASSDHGLSWQPVTVTDGTATLTGDRPLALKLVLQAAPDGSPPYVKGLQVDYHARAIAPLVLENDQVRLTFSGASGALIGLTNKQTQTDYLVAGVPTPLFSFVGYRPEFGTVTEIGFGQAQLGKVSRPEPEELRLALSLLGGSLTTEVSVRLEGQLARIGMQVTNKSPYDLAQVRLLSLKGLRIGRDCTDDYLFTPITTGSVVKYPAALEYPRQIYTDRPLAYPGMATMCWMDLWDEQGGGVYYACEDKRYRVTELTFSNGTEDRPVKDEARGTPPPADPAYRYARAAGAYVNLGFDKRLRIPRGAERFAVPEVVVGVHRGDWHWGADQYRAWSEPWMAAAKQTPDWFRDCQGFYNCHMIHLGSFVDLVKGRPHGGRQGTMRDTVFPLIAMWCQNASCEAYWSTPVLHLLLGNEEEFAAGVQKQHELGHRFISYNLPRDINPLFNQGEKRIGIVPIRMYSPDQVPPVGFYPEVGLRLYGDQLRSPDGQYAEAGTCWGATRWRNYERHIIFDKYIKQYGNDGMYLDGAGLDDLGTQDCKRLTHGHQTYGDWTYDFLQWLKTLRDDAREVRPGAVFAGEGMGDVYHMYLDTGLFYPENAPDVYLYTCPWARGLLMPGTAPIPGWPDGGLEYAAVYGLKIAGFDHNFEQDPARFRRFVAFRDRFYQFQSRARFLGEVGLSVADPQVKARLFVRSEPGTHAALVVTFNPGKRADTRATLDAGRVGKLQSAWWCDMAGGWRPLTVAQNEAAYSFTLPASELSACLLVERCEPLLQIADIVPIVPGETGAVHVTVSNPEQAALSGEVSLGLPPGWKSEPRPLRLGSGASQTLDLPCTVAPGTAYDVHDLYAVVRDANRETRRCQPLGVCRPVQAELDYVAADRLRVTMHNANARAMSGTCTLALPAGVTAEPPQAAFSLPPAGDGELTFQLANTATIQTREHVKATLRYGQDVTCAYEFVQPPLLNGGFEQDSAGDGYPDYWNYRAPEDCYLRKGVALDRSVVAEGTQSLRLEPHEQTVTNHVLTTFLRLIPAHHYRLSCRIRRSANHPGIGARLFSLYSRDGRRSAVDLYVGCQATGPLNEWQRFEAEFTTVDLDVPYNLLLFNSNHSPATVWFDDVRIEEVK